MNKLVYLHNSFTNITCKDTVLLQVYIGERIVKINQFVQKLWNFSQYLSNAPRMYVDMVLQAYMSENPTLRQGKEWYLYSMYVDMVLIMSKKLTSLTTYVGLT